MRARLHPSRLTEYQIGWLVLVPSLALAAALILWLDRGTTYNVDQIRIFTAAPGFDLEGLFEPQNGNLILTTNVAYKVLLGAFGADFLSFRIIHVLAVVVTATLLYLVLRRRVGSVLALVPTLILLFFGSDWGHVTTALGFTVLSSVAGGLAALLLLDRDDRVGDLGACASVLIALASFSIGLAFLAGVAVSVLLRPDRLKRTWVFGVPLVAYVAWWLWARGSDSPSQEPDLSNLLLVPDYAFTSLAAVLASLTGLNYQFESEGAPTIAIGPGAGLAVLALVGLGLYLARKPIRAELWVALAITLTFWTLGALVAGVFREPTKTRYMYPGAVMVLLVASATAIEVRRSQRATVIIFSIGALALATNLALMRDGAAWSRNAYSAPARAQFTMLDLAGSRLAASYDPRYTVSNTSVVSTPAGPYLAAAERYGSPGFTLAELASQPEGIRAIADQISADALEVRVEPTQIFPDARCRRLRSSDGGVQIELPQGGSGLVFRSSAPAHLAVGRFAQPTVDLGQVDQETAINLKVPGDASSVPWQALLTTSGPVTICNG